MQLRGATALVTGGAHRIGREIALALARAGAHVVINYHRSQAAADATAVEARDLGVRALPFRADAADRRQVDDMVAAALSEFGRIDLLVANAGVFRRTPLATAQESDWDDMMRLNFSTFSVPALRIGPLMRERGAGCIIALSDVAAIRPWAEYGPYCAAKGAVAELTRQLAVDLAPAVRVNAVAPGPILFPDDFPEEARQREIGRTTLRRQGRPEHVADAVLFLARNDYVTGVLLPVDGGRLLA